MKLSQWIKGAALAAAAALLAPTAQAAEYELAVAGRQVTDANKDDILGDGGSVRFSLTGTNGTLTLSNAAITNVLGGYTYDGKLSGIVAGDAFALTIVLEGSNVVKAVPNTGIYANDMPLTITGGGSLSLVPNADLGIVAKGDLTIDGVTVSVEGPSGGGIKCRGNLTITNADVTANSLGVGDGIECQRLSIGGASRLVATTAGTGDAVGQKSALWFKNGIEIGDGLVVLEPSPYWIADMTIHAEGDGGVDGALRVVIGPPVAYPVWVGGVQVTDANAEDIFGDGSAWFEGTATNGTLALSNAVVTNAYAFASPNSANLYAGEGFDLTVRVEGSNRLANTAADGYAVYAGGALSITGDGVLVGEEGMSGIVARGNLSIDGATVVAKGGTTGLAGSNVSISNATVHAAGWARGVGIPSGGNVSIVDSKVVATGKAGGVSISGALSVEGASQLEAEATMAGGVAVDADGGITIGEGLAVVVPVGGGRSADGRSIVDAAGNAAGRAAIAAAGSVLGSGTEEDPYVIYDYATLVAFAGAVNGGQNYAWGVLAADIAATGADWVPIGTNFYSGTFDGAGHVISGLANAGMPAYAGLFGEVYRGGVVRNVRLAGVAFNGEWAGGVAGQNYGTVSNCCVSGRIQGKFYAGGVAGENSGTVANCHNIGAVSDPSWGWGGGIAGMNTVDGSVAQCHNTGAVSYGGVVGFNDGTVKNSYCPDSLGVLAICGGSGRVSGECKELGAVEYTDTWYFNGWDFNNVWAMGTEGPYLRVLGERVEYPVWVDGVQVTDVNSGDILGDGTARFAGTMTWGTLALSNAVIINPSGTLISTGISTGSGFDLAVTLAGSNRVENAGGGGYGIRAGGNLTLGGAGSLTIECGSLGIEVAGTLRIENTTVAASSGQDGLNCAGSIVLSNATVSAMGKYHGIYANETVTFSGASRVEATATNSDGEAVRAHSGITVGVELSVVEPSGGELVANEQWFIDANGNAVQHVLIAPTAYDLWVGGVQVTAGNAGDVLGDGTVRFEGTATNGTLALSGAVITNAVEYQSGYLGTAGIYAGDGFDLTISLDGSNRVANANQYGKAILAEGNLSLGGAGSLTVESSSTGIEVNGNLRIEGVTVAASGDYGLHSDGNIVLTNATVSATGGGGVGIHAHGSVAFTGESRVEATTTYSDLGAIYAHSGITVGAELRLVKPDGGGLEADGQRGFVDANGYAAQHVRIEPETGYELWVGGVQVGSGNAGDIFGDGTARFEGTAAGGTLVLSNAVVTNAVKYQSGWTYTACIYAGSGVDLTISLAGSNRVENAGEAGKGIVAKGNLSVVGEGTLTVESTFAGIDAAGNLLIEGTTVASSGSYGFNGAKDIVLTNATVSATGSLDGIKANVSVAFAGDSRVEATGAAYGIYSGESISFAGGSRVEATGTEYGIYSGGGITFAEYCRVEATGSQEYAINADGGITIVEWESMGVALPFGGDLSGDGRTIVDAEGNTATNALVARFYEIMVTGGSSTNQYAVEGASIEVTANEPVAGRAFVQWSSNVEGLEFEEAGASPTRFTMPATNVAVEAVFMPIVLTWKDDPAEYPYTGGEIEPPFDVALEGVDLYLGTNYTVSWADNVNVGTATLTVTLTNRPSGVQSNSFRIKPKALDEESVELNLPTVGWCTFDGTALQPGFNIKDPALHESDLVVVWTNNVGPGTASVLFTGTNNYAGRVEKTFEIKWASERVDGTEWSYRTDLGGGTNATVTGASPAEGVLTVPGTLGGVPVAGIGDGAFEGCTNLTGFVMGDGVQDIGEEAFKGCTGLTNVVLGAGIESVGANAFAGCDALETVWVPIGQQGTGLLDAAGLPAGCAIRYYGTQTVTFDANGGTCATATKDYAIGAPYGELPEAKREGHSFQGWWATNAAGAVEVTTNSVVTEEASRTLEARWRLDLVALTVEAGRWGRAEAVFGGTTNVVAGGTATNFAVGYGSTVTVRAVPDGGFAVDGEGTAEFASLTNAASVAFAFLPEPTATLRWKYARNANGWFCAQVAIPWHAGYGEAMEKLRFLFADRRDGEGRLSAYLADTSTAFVPLGTVETHEGTEYRAAKIATDGFSRLEDGARAVYGVSDATLQSSLASVPKAERKIALRVVNRNIETVEPLGNKIGYLAWETAGKTRFLAVAPNGVAAGTSAGPLAVATLNRAAAFGMDAAAMARGTVTCRLTGVSFGSKGVKGTFAIAAEDGDGVTAESEALSEGVRLRVYGAESLAGEFAELDGAACGVELTGRTPPYGFKVARPGGARFFRIELEGKGPWE